MEELPPPRRGHFSATIDGEVYIFGGCSESELDGSVYYFNQESKKWQKKSVKPGNQPPPNLHSGACASLNRCLYIYGGDDGGDGQNFQNSLYQLDIDSMEWTQLPSGSMRMVGCRMVVFEDQLILFGGYGYPSDPTFSGAEFLRHEKYNDGRGWTNALHTFNVKKGMWSSPKVTGIRPPPPCNRFTFTKIDDHHAVLFGGYGPLDRYSKNVYILDLMKMEWSRLVINGKSCPGRDNHSAVCLGYGGDHPQLLVTGGLDKQKSVLDDAWILDIRAQRWRRVNIPSQARCMHSTAAFRLCPGLMEVTLFGGCPRWPRNFKNSTGYPVTANTTLLQFIEEHQSMSDGLTTNEWVVTNILQLGCEEEAIMEAMASTASLRQACEDAGNKQERSLKEALKDSDRRAQSAEKRATAAESRCTELQRKLQQLEMQWVVNRKEIQVTGPELGRGGWATVSVATFRGVCVAAKCVHNQIISAYNIQLFKREMNMAARIRHPNLLQFIGATLGEELIILTELMPTSLRRELESQQQHDLMPPQQVTSIGVDVARALNYLHLMQPHPLIHRDISSANVLLQPLPNAGWRAKVSDYGTVNFLQKLQTVAPGNPTYAAPEANDPTQQSPKMDIFSFGVLLLEMLTGEFPDPDQRSDQLRNISHQPLLVLVQRCLSHARENRPSASNIISELNHNL